MWYKTLFDWLLNLINVFSSFGSWLVTPFFDTYTPLTFFSLGGLSALIVLLVIHLVNPLN